MSDERETLNLTAVPQAVVHAISRAEIDSQITTARAFPRSIKAFQDAARSMATMTEKIADECYYALPARSADGDDKPIEGASVRLAEILVSAWGNCRAGAQILDEGTEFVVAQGVFQDMERNTYVTKQVRRRITTKSGRRYGADMIANTMNAACSIAFRNAVTAGIPRALWEADVYEEARKTSVGDAKTLVARRTAMLSHFEKQGVPADRICATIGVRHVEDIDLSKLATLKGLAQAIRDGETTIEQAFPPKPVAATASPATPGTDTSAKGVDGLAARMGAVAPAGAPPVAAPDVAAPAATKTAPPSENVQPAPSPAAGDGGKPLPPSAFVPGSPGEAAANASAATAVADTEAGPAQLGAEPPTIKAFPLLPINEDTPVYLGHPTDEPKRAPLGALRWDGIENGSVQWHGTEWRVVDEDGAEAAYEHCVWATRKRLSKMMMERGFSRGGDAMAFVAKLLKLDVVPSGFAMLSLDQLVAAVNEVHKQPQARKDPAPPAAAKKGGAK